jgi:hypothetical protein
LTKEATAAAMPTANTELRMISQRIRPSIAGLVLFRFFDVADFGEDCF